MASGYRTAGVDFDDLFDPYVEGPSAQDCGRRVGGTDLSRRYAHIQYGSKRADVGYRVGGMDVSNLWAARGSASYRLPFNGQVYSSGNGAKTNSTGSASASISIDMLSDGSYSIRESIAGGGNNRNNVVASGRWLPAGASAGDYELQFSISNQGAAYFSNGAPSFASLATSRSASVSVSVPARSTSYEHAAAAVNVHLRRAGGTEQVSTFTASVSASGWV